MNIQRKPDWLKIDFKSSGNYSVVSKILKINNLHTICVSGRCPNLAECWNRGTATFMILGNICTRSCKFCNTLTGNPLPPDPAEPNNVANAVKTMNLRNVVLTSVTRDDLADGGAEHWAKCILSIKAENPAVKIETLIPDFCGNKLLINKIADAKPNIISHNIETVKRLTPTVRNAASFETSLAVLQYVSSKNIRVKSGLMLGLGETEEEIFETMDSLLESGCEVLTLGQYLQPTKKHLPVAAYIRPEKFAEYKKIALQKGFGFVESGPLVRSSYHAENCMI
ncbi:MAG: lipoyl synthase [Prevotellaceae bacterium]|jgi:lipoic acid synthetase|nr:lipoyl synthase [Prevotellaceae bacterium]